MKYCNKVLILSIIFILFFGLISNRSYALTKSFQAISLYPATDGGPYIGIWGSKNLNQLNWELGTLGVYAYRPLQLTANGSRSRGILDNTIIQHLYGQIGIIDQWLSFGLDLPIGWWADFRDPNIATATNQNKIVIGDINIHLKSELLRTDHFGLAILPSMTIPTGYGQEFFGNGNITGGGTIIAEIKPIDKWSIALNAGAQGRQTFNFRDMEMSNRLELGLGTAIQIANPVSLVAEIASTTRLSGPFSEKVESPTEARGAIKWNIGKTGLLANLGGTVGIIKGNSAPIYSVFAGLSFSPTRREYRPRIAKESDINFNDYTIYFTPGNDSINDSKEAKKICDLSDKIRNKKMKIKVVGHTDSTGPKTFNEKLSQKRASKVAWFLKLLGIDSSRIIIQGNGSSNPVGDNKTIKGRAKNRRVDFSSIK